MIDNHTFVYPPPGIYESSRPVKEGFQLLSLFPQLCIFIMRDRKTVVLIQREVHLISVLRIQLRRNDLRRDFSGRHRPVMVRLIKKLK